LAGSNFLAANLYAKSVFGEDALVNVSVERKDDVDESDDEKELTEEDNDDDDDDDDQEEAENKEDQLSGAIPVIGA
jgi:hypothetical protein